jgi:hypothetical protein
VTVTQRLKDWLSEQGVAFRVIEHAAVFTSEEAAREEIAFNAGSNTVSMVMRGDDFLRCSGARLARFSRA